MARVTQHFPDSKNHGANVGLIWGGQDPGGPHVGPINFVIWVVDMWGTSYQNVMYQSSLRRRVITGGSENAISMDIGSPVDIQVNNESARQN